VITHDLRALGRKTFAQINKLAAKVALGEMTTRDTGSLFGSGLQIANGAI